MSAAWKKGCNEVEVEIEDANSEFVTADVAAAAAPAAVDESQR